MADTWFKIKVWTKLILIGLATIFVALFVLENYSITTSVWLFGTHTMTVLELLTAHVPVRRDCHASRPARLPNAGPDR
jgi:hypothetical protein